MVCGRNIIVTVGLDALDCVVSIKAKLLQDLLVDRVVKRHKFLLGEKTLWGFVFKLFIPGMLSYGSYVVAFFRVYL